MPSRRWLGAVAALVMASLAACTGGSQPRNQTGPSSGRSTASTSTPPASTSPSTDPRAEPAVAAYVHYIQASYVAQRTPPRLGAAYPAGGDFTKYSFDPIRGQEAAYVLSLAQRGHALRGTPASPQPSVESVDLVAKPFPTVTLTDCMTSASAWKEYDVKTGKEIPNPYATRTPLRLRVQVILYQGHWGVYKIDHLTGQTCPA